MGCAQGAPAMPLGITPLRWGARTMVGNNITNVCGGIRKNTIVEVRMRLEMFAFFTNWFVQMFEQSSTDCPTSHCYSIRNSSYVRPYRQ